jgi:type IV pilus assembly protein PilM
VVFTKRFSTSIGPVGIDIGTRSIRLLQLREHAGEPSVVAAAEVKHPETADPAEHGAAVTEAVRHAFVSGGFIGRKCVLCLSRCDLAVQPVRMPRMPEGDLRQALRWEASERFSLPRDGCEVDFLRTGAAPAGNEAREEFLLIAASHERLNRWLNPLMDAGLRIVAVDASFAAIARAYSRMQRRESDQEVVRAIVEVGASGSVIMILRGDQVSFCKPLSFSGQEMDRAVASRLRMDPGTAGELRASRLRNAGSGDNASLDSTTDRAVYEAVRPLLGDLVREVTLCMRYYGVTFRGRPPEQVILTGGESAEPHLDEMITQACKSATSRDDSVGTQAKLHAEIDRLRQGASGVLGSWAVASGLSMRGLASERADRKRTHPAVRRDVA